MKTSELGAVMFVGVHPDDEIWTAGGLMAEAVQGGQRVMCVTATRGEGGVQNEARWPQRQLAQIRTGELGASLAVLGVKEYVAWDYPDGGCAAVDEAEAAGRVRVVLEEFRPDTVLTFGPDGYTGHPDHQAVNRWVARAVRELGESERGWHGRVLWVAVQAEQYDQLRAADEAADIFFARKPPLVEAEECVVDLRLDSELTALKRRAFEAVPSQTGAVLASGALDRPGEALAWECFVEAKGERDGRQ